MLVVLAMAALGLAAWWLLRGDGSAGSTRPKAEAARPRASGAPVDRSGDRRPSAVAATLSTPPLPTPQGGALPPEQRPIGAIDHGRAWARLPASYAIKLRSASVAIRLTGDPDAPLAGTMIVEPAPGPTVELRGRVLEGGQPAPGVTVVVGQLFAVSYEHLYSTAAVVTDGDGRFAVPAPASVAWAVALGPRSWSVPTPIVADRDTTLELASQAAGLEVIVREDGAPLDAKLAFRTGVLSGDVDAPDGQFRFAALPPGPLRIEIEASQEFGTGEEPATPIEVVLVPGQIVRRTVDLTSANATVAAVPVIAEGWRARTAEWFLLAPPEPTTLADLRARATGTTGRSGTDVGAPYQFHRITPAGPRVACGIFVFHSIARGGPPPIVRWGCASVDVPATGVVEVEVPIDRP